MPPLRHRMLDDMQIRTLSPHTQRAYVENVSTLARHFDWSLTLRGDLGGRCAMPLARPGAPNSKPRAGILPSRWISFERPRHPG